MAFVDSLMIKGYRRPVINRMAVRTLALKMVRIGIAGIQNTGRGHKPDAPLRIGRRQDLVATTAGGRRVGIFA